MMRSLSSEEHDTALARGLNVLVFRVTESRACQLFQPELDELVRRRPECAVWTVEAMQQRDLAERHGLRALPSIVIYRDGLPARRFAGGVTADDLGRKVDEVAAADMKEEFNDWMIGMLETGEAGSPFIGSRPGQAAGRPDPPTSSGGPTVLGRPLSSARPTTQESPTNPARPTSAGRPTNLTPPKKLTRATTPGEPMKPSEPMRLSRPMRPSLPAIQGQALSPLQQSQARPMTALRPMVPTRPAGEDRSRDEHRSLDEDRCLDEGGSTQDGDRRDGDQLQAGRAAWYAGEDETAIRHLTAVLAQEPASPTALNARGQVLADSGAGEAALADLDRFLTAEPEPHPLAAAYARSARGLALAQVGRPDEAAREIAAALRATPHNAWAHLRHARIHLLGGDRAGATPLLKRSLEANNPPLTRAQRALAESLLRAD